MGRFILVASTPADSHFVVFTEDMNSFDIERIRLELQNSIDVKQALINTCLDDILRCAEELTAVARQSRTILFCGNGGSASDSMHLATELLVRLRSQVERPSLPALSLASDPGVLTAGANDYGFDKVFSRAVEGHSKHAGALVGISTSGNSANVLEACKTARSLGLRTIGLLGNGGGTILAHCDAAVVVPSAVTKHIQEAHIAVGHIWCEYIEENLFPDALTS